MKKSEVFGYLILAFGLGAVIGILFAPRKGEETRKILTEKMEDNCKQACDLVTDKVAKFRNQFSDYMEDLKEGIEK
jgi:gas vesicle protein